MCARTDVHEGVCARVSACPSACTRFCAEVIPGALGPGGEAAPGRGALPWASEGAPGGEGKDRGQLPTGLKVSHELLTSGAQTYTTAES